MTVSNSSGLFSPYPPALQVTLRAAHRTRFTSLFSICELSWDRKPSFSVQIINKNQGLHTSPGDTLDRIFLFVLYKHLGNIVFSRKRTQGCIVIVIQCTVCLPNRASNKGIQETNTMCCYNDIIPSDRRFRLVATFRAIWLLAYCQAVISCSLFDFCIF